MAKVLLILHEKCNRPAIEDGWIACKHPAHTGALTVTLSLPDR